MTRRPLRRRRAPDPFAFYLGLFLLLLALAGLATLVADSLSECLADRKESRL